MGILCSLSLQPSKRLRIWIERGMYDPTYSKTSSGSVTSASLEESCVREGSPVRLGSLNFP